MKSLLESLLLEDKLKHIVVSAIICVVLNLILVGCKATEVVHVPTIHTVETIMRDTIVEVRIPEHYAERETRDTISELSNPFAYSRAEVSGGKLTHSLGIVKDATVKERVKVVETIIRDSIPYPVEVEVIREVDKPLRGWQVSLMWVGAFAIALVVGYIVIKAMRR